MLRLHWRAELREGEPRRQTELNFTICYNGLKRDGDFDASKRTPHLHIFPFANFVEAIFCARRALLLFCCILCCFTIFFFSVLKLKMHLQINSLFSPSPFSASSRYLSFISRAFRKLNNFLCYRSKPPLFRLCKQTRMLCFALLNFSFCLLLLMQKRICECKGGRKSFETMK